MTPADMASARARAIRFYGRAGYQQILRVAEAYFVNNNLPIPSDGIESLPSYWATINQLLSDDLK